MAHRRSRRHTPMIFVVSAVALLAAVGEGIRLPEEFINKRDEANPRPEIAGGAEADPGQFPWQVSLQATNCETGYHLCGGTLITPEWVLTAAHCLDHEKPQWLWVVSGDHDLAIEEETEQVLLVDFFIQHPDYTYWTTPYQNDVGLIHLSTSANIDTFTKLAKLPSLPTDYFQGPGTEYGWGQMSDGIAAPSVMHYANIPLRDSLDCTSAYGFDDPKTLCAGQDDVGFCMGDNGGGLQIWSTEEHEYVIGGISSWRAGCAEKGKPGVYMSVLQYLNWIKKTIATEYPGEINNCEKQWQI